MARRHPEVLVAPTVTFLAVVALVGFARVYERSPIQAPSCGFRNTFGIPCLSCGGTRAFESLSHGHLLEAIAFNPAVILGVVAVLIWFIVALTRFYRGRAPGEGRRWISVKKLSLLLFSILTLNWIYLILFLP
ncbi:MAG: DUF2752 domain-containing protein [Verrucomicrobiales bacterium]|nr:DUF2752 domain-containing protein [Verrucomicrobiales bacterium]